MAPKSRKSGPVEDIDWFTISYKTIYAGITLVVLLLAGGGAYWYMRTHPSTVIVAPPPDTTAPATTARFTAIAGTVKVRPQGELDYNTADKGVALKRGDFVSTAANSTAEITFFDGTVIHVRPNSLITIEESSQDAGGARRVKTQIRSGEVNFTTPAQNTPGSQTSFTTETFSANAAADTQGSVTTANGKEGEVKIFRGNSTVRTAGGEQIAVGSNSALPVGADGRAGPRIVLPESPTLQAPPHQAEISYPDPVHATTLLAWKTVPTAWSYHIVLDTTAFFNKPLVDRKDYTETQVEVRGLDNGKYYWRVAAVDKEGHEGAFSDFARFTVTKSSGGAAAPAVPPAKLVLETLDLKGNILQAKGTSEPGASVTVNGQRVDVGPRGEFNEYIQLEQVGKQVVVIRAVNINGGVAEERRQVVVGY